MNEYVVLAAILVGLIVAPVAVLIIVDVLKIGERKRTGWRITYRIVTSRNNGIATKHLDYSPSPEDVEGLTQALIEYLQKSGHTGVQVWVTEIKREDRS